MNQFNNTGHIFVQIHLVEPERRILMPPVRQKQRCLFRGPADADNLILFVLQKQISEITAGKRIAADDHYLAFLTHIIFLIEACFLLVVCLATVYPTTANHKYVTPLVSII